MTKQTGREMSELEAESRKIKLLDYIEHMSHEMLTLAEAAELYDVANALGHVETVAREAI